MTHILLIFLPIVWKVYEVQWKWTLCALAVAKELKLQCWKTSAVPLFFSGLKNI